MLTFLLTGAPERMSARRVCDFVFQSEVANRNVANALLVRGSLTFGGAVFLLHSSVEAAMATALSLPEEDAPLTPHRP
jgi:hypothetical protein